MSSAPLDVRSDQLTDDANGTADEPLLDESSISVVHSSMMRGDPNLHQIRQFLVCRLDGESRRFRPRELIWSIRGEQFSVFLRERFGGLRASFSSVAEDENTERRNVSGKSEKESEILTAFRRRIA